MFKLDGHITKGGYRNDAVMDWFAGVTENPLVDQATRESCPRCDDTDLAKSAPLCCVTARRTNRFFPSH
jgi:hypothetical protein